MLSHFWSCGVFLPLLRNNGHARDRDAPCPVLTTVPSNHLLSHHTYQLSLLSTGLPCEADL